MAVILDGRAVAAAVEENLKARVAEIVAKTGFRPKLATLIVGENPSSVTYVRMKGRACERIGLEPLRVVFPETASTEEVLAEIRRLNDDPEVCGIFLQHPAPAQIDEIKCFNAIRTDKDVDGLNAASFGAVSLNQEGFSCATPAAIMKILDFYRINPDGMNVAVIGRSPILGKPVSMLLLNANATVTICHTRTRDLPAVVKSADMVVACVGRPKFVRAEWIKPGAVLIDAGYNEGNVGDIDLENCVPLSSAYTPVPGGVGPVTICMLMSQCVLSAEKKYL